MGLLPRIVSEAWPRRTSFGPCLGVIAAGFALSLAGCAVDQGARPPGAIVGAASAAYVPQVEVGGAAPMGLALPPRSSPSIIQVQYSAAQATSDNAAAAPLPETLPAPGEVAAGMSLDQAIGATLLADPKIRAGLEAIHQASGDFLTSSLRPNPTLIVEGQYLPLRPFTVQQPGGPSEFDVQVGYPIDWLLFGKRAAAMVSARLGVRQSEADYAELIRQRVTATATAFFDVLEAKSLLDLATGRREPDPT